MAVIKGGREEAFHPPLLVHDVPRSNACLGTLMQQSAFCDTMAGRDFLFVVARACFLMQSVRPLRSLAVAACGMLQNVCYRAQRSGQGHRPWISVKVALFVETLVSRNQRILNSDLTPTIGI